MAAGDPDKDAVAETVAATPSVDGANVSRPISDRLARAVARAKLGQRLFGAGEQVTLGRYELVDMLGAGGMGVVWGARDPELDRRVAVKVVRNRVPAARERMLREGQALAKLSHPNVVAIYDVGVVDDQVYLVMEWVDGDDLRVHAKANRPQRELFARYLAAGVGLAAIHGAGLIHRDFKPDNVLVGNDGRARVLDLGLCRDDGDAGEAIEGDMRLTHSGLVVGTPASMAPEQLDGGAVDARADQFAFCVSVWESLAGERPHQGNSMAALREAIAHGQRAGIDRIPRRLRPVLDRGLAADPAQRFPSMVLLLRALDRAWRRPRRIAVAAGIAAVALGSAGAAYALRSSPAPVCRPGHEVLATADTPQARALLGELRAAGARGRGIAAYLDGWRERWMRLYDATCDAPSDAAFAPRRACLEALATQLDHTLSVRVQLPIAMVVRNEPQTRLQHPEVCLEHPQTVFVPPVDPAKRGLLLRSTTARFATIAVVNSRSDRAPVRAELDAVAAAARATGDDAVHAMVLLEVAEAHFVLGDRTTACPEYAEAANLAERAGVDRARAAALLAGIECADSAARPAQVARAEAVIRRIRDRTLEAYLDHLLAEEHEAAGRLDEAMALLRQARSNWRELGATHRVLLMVKHELEILRKHNGPGDVATARALLDDTLSRLPADDPEHASLTTLRDQLR
jgi:hypothetical protein